MPKAYSYMRFSTPTQAAGDSKRRQYKQAEEYASANGLELDDALRYDDYGVSAFRGANVEIGKLGQFMEAIRRGEVAFGSFLLVESLDRISRDLILPAQNIFTQIILEGITIVTLADRRQYSVELVNKYPFLLIEAIVILIRANEESTTKSLRAKANWENKRACLSTKLLTSIIPAWLNFNTGSNRLEIIPERGAIINRIYQERLDGKSTRNIAKGLDEDNIATWVTCNKKRAVTWSYHYVWRILSSSAVIGTLVPRKRAHNDGRETRIPLAEIKGYYPAVVSEEIFNRVQESNRHFAFFPRTRRPFTNIFYNIARCALCGLRLEYNAHGKHWSSLTCLNIRCMQSKQKAMAYPRLQAVFLSELINAHLALPTSFFKTNKYNVEISEKLNVFMLLRHKLLRLKAMGINDTNNLLEDAVRETQCQIKTLINRSLSVEFDRMDEVPTEFINAAISKHFKPDQINKMLTTMCDEILISSVNIAVKFKSGRRLNIEYDKKWSRLTDSF